MFQYFLNPWLLAGLAGIALPVLAHLIRRRNHDIVEWAAMQFLLPSRKTRRRLRLDDFLLLLIRIAMIILLAVAAARPWIPGGIFSGYRSAGSRSVVIIVDGSGSMSRSSGTVTLHTLACRRAEEFINSLNPGDRAGLIDARDIPDGKLLTPVLDHQRIRQRLATLPAPAGSADLCRACESAIAALGRVTSSSREIVVFTDRQRTGWKPDSDAVWNRLDDQLSFPSVRPQIWVVDVSEGLAPVSQNIALGRIPLSREFTVPGFPIRLQVPVRNHSLTETAIDLRLKINGQQLPEYQQSITLPASGQTSAQFELTLKSTGTQLISIESSPVSPNFVDQISADDTTHVALHVADSIPVLMIEGSRSDDPLEQETWFASMALAPPDDAVPGIQLQQVRASEVTPDQISESAMIFCGDVIELPATAAQALHQHVRSGHGLLISLSDKTTAESFRKVFVDTGILSHTTLNGIREMTSENALKAQIEPVASGTAWIDRFRTDPARSFLKATWRKWWQIRVTLPETIPETNSPGAAIPIAKLTTGDPLMLESRCGRGIVLLYLSSLSRRWNDLPSHSDYVPWLHETVLHAAGSDIRRNVNAGEPLVLSVAQTSERPLGEQHSGSGSKDPGVTQDTRDSDRGPECIFRTPSGSFVPETLAARAGDEAVDESSPEKVIEQRVLRDTIVPGIYELTASPDQNARVLDSFVVHYDHRENDLTELTDGDRATLKTHDRLRFVSSGQELLQSMYGSESQSELWIFMMCLFVLLLMLELFITRQIVRRRYQSSGEIFSPETT